MTLKEAIESGKWFKLPEMADWLKAKKDNNNNTRVTYATDNNFENFISPISIDDILREDWQIKEEWYDGNFKKKYPNGVLCEVWDKDNDVEKFTVIVVDYDENSPYPFTTIEFDKYKFAEPITDKNKLPAILEEEINGKN